MKNIFLLLFISITIFSCKKKKGIPDVSDIKADITLQRFDKDFFSIDSNDVLPGLNRIHGGYPVLTDIFLQNILGVDSASTLIGVRRFLHLNESIDNSVNKVFTNNTIDDLKKQFQKAFQFTKYYFPDYKLPKIITVVGPIDALAQMHNMYTPDFLGPDFLGISLQFYLGKNFEVYNEPYFIENVAPQYRSRRFSKEYIIGDAMTLIVDDLFPDKSSGLPLVEQMIEKGKQWYLLDKFLPTTPDSVKTGYTQLQLDWCKENEGNIWSEIIKNEDLNSLNPIVIQTYIGDGPYTQGFSPEYSPGNLGQWIGWQIVKKFVSKNSGMKPEEIMRLDAKKILEGAKYKPR